VSIRIFAANRASLLLLKRGEPATAPRKNVSLAATRGLIASTPWDDPREGPMIVHEPQLALRPLYVDPCPGRNLR
jgi:hypothetical protein